MFVVIRENEQTDGGSSWGNVLGLVRTHPWTATGTLCLAVVAGGYAFYHCRCRRRDPVTRRGRRDRGQHAGCYPGETTVLHPPQPLCYRGLRNIGNSCYLNCILQSLAAVQPHLFPAPLGRGETHPTTTGRFSCILYDLLTALNMPSAGKGGEAALDPTPLVHAMGGVLTGEQQDAHELLQAVLSVLSRLPWTDAGGDGSLGTVLAANNSRFVTSRSASVQLTRRLPWEGALVALIRCLGCGGGGESGTRTTPFSMLTLNLPSDDVGPDIDLERVFCASMAPVHLKDYVCATCGQQGECWRVESVLRWPSLLVLHLQRTRQTGWFLGKDQARVRFPARMVAWRQPWELIEPSEHASSSNRPSYELAAVVEHQGSSLSHGHYQAYRRAEPAGASGQGTGLWLACSDATVQVVTLEQVLQAQSYLLFYTRA